MKILPIIAAIVLILTRQQAYGKKNNLNDKHKVKYDTHWQVSLVWQYVIQVVVALVTVQLLVDVFVT